MYLRHYIMVAIEFYLKEFHRVRTYDEIIHDDVLFPTDKIKLPDRMATQLRNLPQLTRFDEIDATVDMAEDNAKVAKERAREPAFQNLMGPGDTRSIRRAQASPTSSDFEDAEDRPSFLPPPPPAMGQTGFFGFVRGAYQRMAQPRAKSSGAPPPGSPPAPVCPSLSPHKPPSPRPGTPLPA